MLSISFVTKDFTQRVEYNMQVLYKHMQVMYGCASQKVHLVEDALRLHNVSWRAQKYRIYSALDTE